MTDKITISIIVPVYNVERYIHKCIDSLLAQTFQNVEIILVDDGSPDNCGYICDEYGLKDGRVKVFHKTNGGLSSARNYGLKYARGEYVAFVDSDDWVTPDFCQTIYDILKKEDADIVCFGLNKVYDDRIVVDKTDCPGKYNSSDAIGLLINSSIGVHDYACNKVFRKILFESIKFREGYKFEDIDIMYRLFAKANNIFIIDSLLYNYLQRNDNITSTYDSVSSMRDRFYILRERYRFIRDNYPLYCEKELFGLSNLILHMLIRNRCQLDDNLTSDLEVFLETNQPVILNINPSIFLKLYYKNTTLFKFLTWGYSLYKH